MIAHNLALSLQLMGLAFFGSLAFCGFMRRAGLGDTPDSRSAHSGVIPTGGGVGLVAGLGLALCALGLSGATVPEGVTPFLSLTFAVAVLGLSDDALTLSAKLKFPILVVLCALAVWIIGPVTSLPTGRSAILLPVWAGFIGSVLWIFVVMNAVNFMDGINGILAICLSVALFGLFGLGIIGGSAATLLLTGLSFAALLGFMPYNVRSRATLFSGDVGSLTLGFIFAGTVLFLVRDAGALTPLLYGGPILILPFLVDVLLTLVQRLRRGENLLSAHNTHLYQRLNRYQGGGHIKTTWTYGIAFMMCGNVAIFGSDAGWLFSPWALLGLTALFSALFFMASKRLLKPA